MYYDNKEIGLAEFIVKKHANWIERGSSQNDWEDEGIVWAIQEYYSSMGEFSEEDWKTIESLGLEEIGIFCEEEMN